jgi:hypothetical protein
MQDVSELDRANPDWLEKAQTEYDGDFRLCMHDMWKAKYASEYEDEESV